MAGQVSGLAVAEALAGFILLWSGIKNTSLKTTLTDLLKGQSPTAVPEPTPTLGVGSGGGSGTSGNGSSGTLPAPLPNQKGTYSNSQLQSLWKMAGGSSSTAAVAACIAQHESGGNATVTSRNPDGGTNVGLWQLDTPGGKGAGYTVAQLQNALTNARVAVKGSSDGTDWSAWSTAPACGV